VYDPRPEIAALKKRFGIDDTGFANMRKALVDGGAVENKPSSEMTEEDWKLLFRAIEVNFGDAA
jgi:L-asparaginase/Glu-tRNA(Gln) amidotransferase subunit D